MILHAGCVARMIGGGWRGVLLRGASGSGKSDLALRLAGRGWTLVADDRVRVWPSGGRLYAAAPEPLAGLVEARGLDVLRLSTRRFVAVHLVADCLPPGAELDRIPQPQAEAVAGVALPRIALRPLESSAPEKLAFALAASRF